MLKPKALLSAAVSIGKWTSQFSWSGYTVWHGLLLCRLPKRQPGISGFADDLEALEATEFFLEENRTATMISVTQQEAFENYEKNGYATEEKEQEMSAKQKKNGREVNSDTTSGKTNKQTTIPYSLGWVYF